MKNINENDLMPCWIATIAGVTLTLIAISGYAETLPAPTTHDIELENCTHPFKNRKPTPEELQYVLAKHAQWIDAYKDKIDSQKKREDPRRANLCEADLSDANLNGAELRGANLSSSNLDGAYLIGANLEGSNLRNTNLRDAELGEAKLIWAILSGARLINAHLIHANLTNARLSNASLIDADLSRAILINANLIDADLSKAKLSNANLTLTVLTNARLIDADLSDADLTDADLGKANLTGANLSQAVFSPKNLPIAEFLVQAKGLSELVHGGKPKALTDLREIFRQDGNRTEARAITAAINRSEQKNLWGINASFRYIFFDLTTEWGAAPGNALVGLVLITFVCAIPYTIVVWIPKGQSGIYRRWGKDHASPVSEHKDPEQLKRKFIKAILVGPYFSLLSAFRMGWRELTVGTWIERMQFRDYTLYATGWVRFVSGLQSLISIYLIAIWTLTYFGNPFE